MKTNYAIYLAILATTVFLACGNQLESVKEYYEGTEVLQSSYFIDADGVQQDTFKTFHLNGNLYTVEYKKDGKTDGLKKIFFEDGKLEVSLTFVDGVHQGPFREYYDSGVLHIESQYTDDVLSGKYMKYYPTGKIEEEISFENNEENGPFKEYHPNGQLHWSGTYVNGDNEVGLLEEFDTSGVLIKKMMCDSLSVCRTTWKKGIDG